MARKYQFSIVRYATKEQDVKKIKVNVISESEFTVQGHGVHTAYIEHTRSLKARPDVIVTVNQDVDVDITHIHTTGLYAAKRLVNGPGKKVVSAHIVPDSLVGSLAFAKWWLPLAKVYLKWFYSRADLVFAVSDATQNDLLALGVEKPITVLYNTIDTQRYRRHDDDRIKARQKVGLPTRGTIVMGAGQVQPRKRLDTFVAAANALPDVTFVWVGGMPFKAAAADGGDMKKLIKNAPKNLLFPGILPLDEMVAYYHTADMFMLPSDQETFGLVIVEAAAADLPVILRNNPEYDTTFAGNVLKFDDDAAAIAAVVSLRESKELYEQSVQGARRIAARFDSREGARITVEHYRTLLAND